VIDNGHLVGFEKEDRLTNIFGKVNETIIGLQWKQFMEIANLLSPEIVIGAFERRACKRELMYIGEEDVPFFKRGEIYKSTDFNGATYSIAGYEKFIGLVYFECVD
jgi:hypothetical protein